MNFIELEKLIKKIVGLKLDTIGYACEMLMFNFEQYALHVECLTRIIKDNDILVTTLDYQSWDGGEDGENNDEWYNLDKYREQIEGGKVLSVKINLLYDLIITLDNDITIQIYIQNSYAHYDSEREQYRFFECSSDDEDDETDNISPHYVVYSKHIEIHGKH